MAKNLKQFQGWNYVLSSDSGSAAVETPRSRRSRKSEVANLILKRDEDSLELKQGDCVSVQLEDGGVEIAVIKDLSFGIDDYIELKVMWFIKIGSVATSLLPKDESEVVKEGSFPSQFSSNDVFITAIQDKILLSSIIERVNVLSAEEWAKIKIDESNQDTAFVCRRGCDTSEDKFTEAFDWRALHKLLETDADAFYQKVKGLTVAPTLKTSKQSTPKPQIQVKKERKVSYRELDTSEDEEEAYDSGSDVADISNSESDDVDLSDSEFETRSKKRKTTSVRSTPRKARKTSRGISVRARTKSKHMKTYEPLNYVPSLPMRARIDFGEVSDNEDKLKTPIFKQARKRLHASAKLKSLPCREDEFAQLYQSVEDAIESQIGTCIYVSGTPGTGKTATVREVVKQLAESYLRDGAEDDSETFDYVELNGLKLISPHSAYEVLWEKISGQRVSPTNAVTFLETHFKKKDPSRKPLVVLMDELDQMVNSTQSVMYNFFNWPTYAESKLIVIAVANTMDLPERMLTNKISSRLGLKRLQFPGYDYKQLAEIIRHRLEDLEVLNSGKLVIKKDAIEFAARKVASVSGDARRALIICRRAIELAEWEYFKKHNGEMSADATSTVQIMHIMKAVNETTNSPVSSYLQSLPFVAKLFISCLLSRKRKTGLAENTMDSIIDEMNNVITMQTSSFLNKNLLKEHIDLNKMMYGVTRENLRIEGFKYVVQELVESGVLLQADAERLALVKLNVSDDEIINVFQNDGNLQGIAGF